MQDVSESNIGLSVVVTAYNAEQSLPELYKRLTITLSSLDLSYEILFVEDRSRDNTWNVLKEISLKDPKVKSLRFVRNFGQHAAITAGIHASKGNCVVLMDGDLQDNPELIAPLYHKLKSCGKALVYVRRMERTDKWAKKSSSIFYNKTFSFLSGIKSDPSVGTFRIMDQRVVSAFRKFTEVNKFIGGLFYWMNFDHDYYDAKHEERKYGKSNYTFMKMLNLASRGLVSFSNKPLHLAIYLGLSCALLSFGMAILFIVRKLMYNISVTGYSSIIVSIFFIGGIILFVLGILGRYISEIYDQVRHRPEYIIEEKINVSNE